MQQWFAAHPFEGLKDTVIAYSSLSIFYDPVLVRKAAPAPATAFEYISEKLHEAYRQSNNEDDIEPGNMIRIPVCYDDAFAADIDFVSQITGLAKQEIIQLHSSKTYDVYMLGFLPGFSYMAALDEKLAVPRKIGPVPVTAGSVGIAGSQTGVYPLPCAGGWQVIGRTPVKLFDTSAAMPVKLKPGDRVVFHPITRDEFEYEINHKP